MEASPTPAIPSSLTLPGEGEDRVLRILESITDGFYGFDADWRFTFINEAGKRILAENHENPEKLIGQNYFEAFPAAIGTIIDTEFHRAVAENTAIEFENFYTPWQRWFAVRGFPIRGGGLSVYFQDVTEKKQSLATLQASEERYRWLFNAIDEGFCIIEMIWDAEGNPHDYKFIEVNPAFEGQTGLISAVGKTARELVPGLESHWFEIYGKVARTGESNRFIQGSEPMGRWFDVYTFAIDADGTRRVAIRCTDITEKKRAELELQASQERYRKLFNSIDEGFCVIEVLWDSEGQPYDYRFIEVNPAFESQTGLSNAAGKTVLELNPNHEKHWFEIYGKVATTGTPVRFIEGSDSLKRWFDLYAFPLGSGDNRRIAVRFTDITEKRRAEQEMQRLTQESHARLTELETLLDVLPIGIAIALDPQCQKIRLNSSFSQVLGLRPDGNASLTAPEGERPTNFVVRDDSGRLVPGDELPMQTAAREGREIRDLELTVEHSDGRIVRLLEYAAPLFDEQGQPRGSVGAFIDITERRQNEDRQRFLLQLAEAVRALSSADEIVATSARLLGQHLRVDRCTYADIEADEDTMNITGDYTHGVASIVGRYTIGQFGSHVLQLMRDNEPYVFEDILTFQPPPEDAASYAAIDVRAAITVPLHKDGRLVALMAVHQTVPRHWTPEDISLLTQVANRCWEAIERMRVTRVLEESEARFRQIADVMPQVVYLARPDGFIEYYNRRWYEYTGEGSFGGESESWKPALHPEDAQPCADRWQHSIRTGEPYEFRYRLHEKRSGTYRWFLTRALPLRNDQGEIIRWYGSATDIDDLIHAEEAAMQARSEAERANRAKDEFLATLSHELRTPLTPVLMAAEGLCDDPSLPPAVHDTLSMMRRNIAMEARLIDDLLDVTRISHGKLSLRLQEGEAHSLIALAVEIVRDEAQAKGLVFHTHLLAPQSFLSCDPSRLQQVFWNLLKNAVKFTPPQGSITIRSYNAREPSDHTPGEAEDRLIIEVADSGIGMTSETVTRIFLPFEQAGLANDHRFGGLGLGLSISKALVDMHHGTISVTSPGLNLGSTFRVSLPILPRASVAPQVIASHPGTSYTTDGTASSSDAANTTTAAQDNRSDQSASPGHNQGPGSGPSSSHTHSQSQSHSAAQSSAPGNVPLPNDPPTARLPGTGTGIGTASDTPARPLRLLVVEDHEPTLTVLSRMLTRAGHTVAAASHMAAALRLAEDQTFDLVISDIGLPDGSGIDLMRTLHTRHHLQGIALTGYGMEEDTKQAHAAGFILHLTKPVEFAQLRRALAQIAPA